MRVTATEAKSLSGCLGAQSKREPAFLMKAGQIDTVVLPVERFQALQAHQAKRGLAEPAALRQRSRVPAGPRRRMRWLLRAGTVWVVMLLLFAGVEASAEPPRRKSILLLNSYHQGFPWTDIQVEGILTELRQSDLRPDLFIEQLDSLRQPAPYPDAIQSAYLEGRYRGRKFDLIVTTDDEALAFVARQHARLFPGVPVVFSDAAEVDIDKLRQAIPVTGVRERLDARATLELAKSLRPKARQIVAFANRGDRSSGAAHAREAIGALQPGIPIVVHEDLKLEEIAATAAALPADDIVFSFASAFDQYGVWHDFTDVIERIGEVSRAPIFDYTSHRVRRGLTLGGRVEDGLEVGRMAARQALRILRGEDAVRIPVEDGPLVHLFNHVQLRRHGIAEASLPAGSTIIDKPPSLYEQHRATVWTGAAALLGMGLTIVSLLVNVRTRRRAEQSLRANEERLRLALEAGGLGFYDLDLVTGAATVSPEYERMLGYEAGELSLNTQDWAGLVHPEDREPAQHTLGECIDGQRRQYRIEYRLRTKTGEWIWIQSVGKIASWDTAGRPQRMLGTHADITVRKQSERQLELMRLSVEFGSDAVFWVNADGSLAYVNEQACRSLGRTRAELLGLRLWQIDADVTGTTWGGIWEQLGRSGEFQKETRHRRIDGGLFPVEVRARAITHDGKTYAIGLAHDITERKRAEATLVQSEERLRQAVRVSGIGIFDHNVDAGSIYWSADLRRAFGWSPDAPVDVSEFVRVVHPEDREAVEAAIVYCHDPSGDGQYRADYRIVKPDGELRWIMALGQTFFEGEGEQRRPLRTVGATLDITERKTAEAALLDLNATLEQRVAEEVGRSREKDHLLIQQSRLAAMGEMIGNIAHQWRQPINALALLLTNLSDAHQYGELSRDYLDTQVGKGHKLIQRMSSTIDDFRNFFRPHRQSQPFQISAAVREALSIVDSSFANHHIAIVFAVRDEAVTAGFVNEYTQVLLNLLSNAKEAIEGSGRQPGRVDLLLQAEHGEARLTVRDNGGGIRADVMPKIFDPYFTTRDHGTGIGLYMSKMIIEANMKGRIEAANVDDGAQFTIVTPLAPGGSASADGHADQAP